MANNATNERDLVLDPSTFAYVQDRSQGEVGIYVGPFKVSLGETDQPVVFDPKQKRFVATPLERAIQSRVIAPEGWYVIMKNPSLQPSGELKLPPVGKNASKDVELTVGRKINIPGPANFALWPGQMTSVVKGHHLRSNQYLLVRVYDEEQATKNRDQAVIKSADDNDSEDAVLTSLIPEDLSIGKLFIIKGTDASFFIPPTGIEVVKDENNNYIRDAETLEVLEYCILLDENGNKRLPRGPAVVFPEPTETFVTKQGHRKYTAFELNEKSGLYIKVIKEYEDETGSHPVGEELFITGADTPVYFPREEHAIIKYGDNKKIQYAVAIPSGEGRYVLNRKTGEIKTIRGPDMLLPDPREEVLVRKILKDKEVALMYPGNTEAASFNAALNAVRESNQSYALADSMVTADLAGQKSVYGAAHASGPITRSQRKKAMRDFAGDEISRGTAFTPPRTITIDNKFDGVVTVNVWTGFAVNVVNKNGNRRVVTGPNTVMLDYDETLESFSLSKGTPKSQKHRKQDVYLRCTNNRVTDQVLVQTKDLVDVKLTLSYRVDFTGDANKWFNVDDYVGLLTDHMRSVLRNEFQRVGIEDFWADKIDLIRNCVLGTQTDGERKGRLFEQNGMKIIDVDFIDAEIKDSQIAQLLVGAQHEAVRLALDVDSHRRSLKSFVELEEVKRARADAANITATKQAQLAELDLKRRHTLQLVELTAKAKEREEGLSADLDYQIRRKEIQAIELERDRKRADLENEIERERQAIRLAELEAKTAAEERRIQAVTPDLIAAMETMGQSEFAAKITHELSPLAILGGESVADVAARLLGGMGLDKVLEALPAVPARRNGKYAKSPATRQD